MNVLITSAGRRSSLLRHFQRAVAERGGKVIAVDTNGLAHGLYVADVAARVAPVDEESFLSDLLGVVRSHNIRVVIPTIDTELPHLARAAHFLRDAGATVVVSDPALIETMADKVATELFFRDRDIRVVRTWLPEALPSELPEELFVKPRRGSASQHSFPIDRGSLERILPLVPEPIIQPRLDGPEITVDCLLDLGGQPIHYVPRTRLRTLGGESIQSETIDAAELESWIIGVLVALSDAGARGPQTVQAFLTDSGPVLTDVNPRFGGGVPLAFAAGGDYPEWILQMVEGTPVEPRLGEYESGLFMTRFFAEHFTRQPWW